jgi:hypothetical protein
MRVFHWNIPPHGNAKSAQICDIEGHRLYVKRTRKGAREFTALIDGKDLHWMSESMDAAKEAIEVHFDKFFPDFNKLD